MPVSLNLKLKVTIFQKMVTYVYQQCKYLRLSLVKFLHGMNIVIFKIQLVYSSPIISVSEFSGGIPDVQLERNIEAWIKRKVSVDVEFKSDEAIKLLQHFGILSKSNDKLHVLSLEAAMRNLPQQPQSLVARTEDTDIAEGYDRDYFLETEDEYKDEEQRSKKYGWF